MVLMDVIQRVRLIIISAFIILVSISVYYSCSNISINTPLSIDFKLATISGGFHGRNSHSSVVFNNKIWIIGGLGDNLCYNDVWSSSDGVIWSQVTDSAGFSQRFNHSSVVFDNKIWVIAGEDYGIGARNDVWFTADGITWTQATDSAAFSPRYGHTSVVFNNNIWVIEGHTGKYPSSDAWFSNNGITWIQGSDSASYCMLNGRQEHSSQVFNNRIWTIAGDCGGLPPSDLNDVWYSNNGLNWIMAARSAEFSERWGHSSAILDNKMWIMGGKNYSELNDVWYSSNGINWTQANSRATYSPRYGHSSVVFNDKIWIIGGIDTNGVNLNDVWYSEMK